VKNYKLHLFLVLFCLAISTTVSHSQELDTVNYPISYSAKKDVIYSQIGNWDGRLDVYYPTTSKPKPLVINIHGGGWNHGTKETQKGFNPFFINQFVVANIEYRLVDQSKAPAAIQDVRCSLLYLVKNAEKYNIDVNQIIIMGSSAGGHLALMAGLSGRNSKFDSNCHNNIPFKIIAIIDKYGITDLAGDLYKGKMVQNWLGDNNTNSDFVASVSPKNLVDKKSPPIFIVHGNADTVVPYKQSENLHKQLTELGIKNEFITIENGGHGKFTKEENKTMNDAMWQFLKEIINP
jgi:acetyl esterase/lipase